MNVIVSNRNKDLLSNLNVDVIKSITGEFTVDELVQQFSNFFYSRMFLDITAIKNYNDLQELQKLSIGLDMSKIIFLLDNSDITNSNSYISKLISMGIYNFTKSLEGLNYLYVHPNNYRDVAHLQNLQSTSPNSQRDIITDININREDNVNLTKKIIGFKNITYHAGATTLIYMLKKILVNNYSVAALEIGRNDFTFFNDNEMFSTIENNLQSKLEELKNNYELVLIDLNNYKNEDICDEIFYLMEPSTIRLNKMLAVHNNILEYLKDKKLILNKSLLNSKDINDFEQESNLKVFYNLPPLNDKEDNIEILQELLQKINLID